MIDAAEPALICSKHKAITSPFLYTAQQVQNEQYKMLGTLLHTARAGMNLWGFMWDHIKPSITILLDKESSISLKQAIILASPHPPEWDLAQDKHLIQLWAAAVSAVPYTDEICQSVTDTLLQIASSIYIQPHIPIGMWSWLKKCPLLPPVCGGRYWGSFPSVIQGVRALQDIETLTSYLLLIWSEWGFLEDESLSEMCNLIQEDLGEIWIEHHRIYLLQHLDHVLRQLDLGFDHVHQHNPKLLDLHVKQMDKGYRQLKEVLLEVDRKAINNLICKSLIRISHPFSSIDSYVQVQDLTQHLCVQFLSHVHNTMLGNFHTTSLPHLTVLLIT